MSKFVKVQQGNYSISVPNGHTITLDVGTNPSVNLRGKVVVTGSLQVEGTYTTIDSVNTTIADNIILLNKGETGNGVSLNDSTSGIEISRGSVVSSDPDNTSPGNALLVLDDSKTHLNRKGVAARGVWSFRDSTGSLMGLEATNVKSSGNLYLTVKPSASNPYIAGVVTVSAGSGISYERRVFDYSDYDASVGPIKIGSDTNALPNAQSVLDVISSAFQYQSANNITDYDTSVSVADFSRTSSPSIITFKVDNNLKAYIDGTGVTIDSIKIYGNNVTSLNGNNLTLSSVTTAIEASGWMLFDNQTSTPSAVAGGTYLYANATIGAGKTGLYIVNTTTSDELVSKKRALLFSMIF